MTAGRTDQADSRTAPRRMPRWRADLRLGTRIAVMRAGGLALALRGDPVARLMHRPWRLDPYPTYARLRAEAAAAGGVTRSRTGIRAVATHEACTAVLRDRRFGVRLADGQMPFDPTDDAGSASGSDGHDPTDPGTALIEPIDLSLLALDPPDHARLRRLAQPTFAPKRLAQYRETARTVTARLLDDAAARGTFDLTADLAAPLPISVIAELLAIPDVDTPRFARWGRALGAALDGVRSVRHAHALSRATADLRALFADLVERRRAEPGEDVISQLVHALDAGTLTLDELVSLAQLLLVAGFETTTNLVGNAVRALHATGTWDDLVADPGLAAGAIEETLRFDPPVQLTARFAHEDVEIGGRALRKDSGVLVLLASAGRDPAAHPDPDRFDPRREQTTAHLAFSGGAHYCLGAALARLEGEVALEMLADRMPRLRPAGRIEPRVATVLRGPTRFPVRAD
ncbi:cytochrome P450 [Actinomycetospora sp. NBRC 106375]|uniref:cytochrome P450 n=1 Tax=Actinomycetospora sp. NBRC 106375 TaxID=3032207 RepID=UPI0024A2D838|nr:cytochrome P450 [Actinomycetospora sp. NBRC 106375]GLZ46132.1 cytochrome P450 [Actinomycetospora sp. NBRC 106375]